MASSLFRCPGTLAAWVMVAACARNAPAPEAAPEPAAHAPAPAARETVTVRDVTLDRRVGVLELRLLAKDAQMEALTRQLDDARQEVVRAMAKLRTLATRAEAASGMAEAEIAVQTLRGKAERSTPELEQAERLLRLSAAEFNDENYGGALYLATQAKGAARLGEDRLAGAQQIGSRPGETPFAFPVPLKVTTPTNVRDGPGTNFPVLFTLAAGALVVGHSYADDWVRVADDSGRMGWVAGNLVTGRQ
jgi:uncharacterized coiled-coil protein SlyX